MPLTGVSPAKVRAPLRGATRTLWHFAFGVEIGAGVVGLPYLHRRIADRIAGECKHPSAQQQDLTDSRCDAVRDD
jgi:hypothetical protein